MTSVLFCHKAFPSHQTMGTECTGIARGPCPEPALSLFLSLSSSPRGRVPRPPGLCPLLADLRGGAQGQSSLRLSSSRPPTKQTMSSVTPAGYRTRPSGEGPASSPPSSNPTLRGQEWGATSWPGTQHRVGTHYPAGQLLNQ